MTAGPYEDADGVRYEVRLEQVPGGVRLAEWAGSQLRRRAPVLDAADLVALLAAGAARRPARRATRRRWPRPLSRRAGRATAAGAGVSRGRSGDFKEELRVEALDAGPRAGRAAGCCGPGPGWELQEAPPMLPAGALRRGPRGRGPGRLACRTRGRQIAAARRDPEGVSIPAVLASAYTSRPCR